MPQRRSVPIADRPTVPAFLALALPVVGPLVAIAVYALTLRSGFAFDDPIAVLNNPAVTGAAPWMDAFTGNFWGGQAGFEGLASWRPLTLWSLRLDALLGAMDSGVFHGVNIALHACVCAVMGILGRRLGLSVLAAAGLSVAIAVLPMGAEAVASIVGRGDLLATLFAALAVVFALGPNRKQSLDKRGRSNRGPLAGIGAWPLALGAMAVALLCKEGAIAIAAPLVLLSVSQRRWGRVISVLAVVGIWLGLRTAAVGWGGGAIPWTDNPMAVMDVPARLSAGLGIIGRIALAWLGPWPIAPDLAAGVSLPGPGSAYSILGATVLALGTLALALSWRAHGRQPTAANRGMLIGLAWAGAQMLLLSNIVVVLPAPLAGRLVYGVCAGLSLALIAGVSSLLVVPGRRGIAGAVFGLWLLVGLPTTLTTASAWASDESLFTWAIDVAPASARARVRRAKVALNAGDPAAAAQWLAPALALRPDHPEAWIQHTQILTQSGDGHAAWTAALRAAAAQPTAPRARANRCALSLDQDVPAESRIAWCQEAVRLMPQRPEPAVNLGRAYGRAGQGEVEMVHLLSARAAFPHSTFVLGHLTSVYAKARQWKEAVDSQQKLIALAPDDPAAAKNLIALLVQMGDVSAANGDLGSACMAWKDATNRIGSSAPLSARLKQCSN